MVKGLNSKKMVDLEDYCIGGKCGRCGGCVSRDLYTRIARISEWHIQKEGRSLPSNLNPNLVYEIIALSQTVRDNTAPAPVTEDPLVSVFSPPPICEGDIIIPDTTNTPGRRLYSAMLKIVYIAKELATPSNTVKDIFRSSIPLLILIHPTTWSDLFKRNGYRVQVISVEVYHKVLDNYLGEEGKEEIANLEQQLGGSLREVATSLYGVLLCLIGKNVTEANCNQWAKNSLRAFLASGGQIIWDQRVCNYVPSFTGAQHFRSAMNGIRRLRATVVLYLINITKGNTTIPDEQANVFRAMLTRLRYSELLAFRLVDTFLVESKFWMLLWGLVAQRLPALREAYYRFNQYGELAPYLKLLTDPSANPQFNSSDIKYLAEICRYIGQRIGQLQLQNVQISNNLKLSSTITDRIDMLITESENALFEWAVKASTDIVDPRVNKKFFRTLMARNEKEPNSDDETNTLE